MDFRTVADDFFINMDLQTALALPRERETVLHFCEAVQKQFPDMTGLFQRENGDFVLEGDRDSGSYRWLELQPRRLSAGYFNPPSPADAYKLHRWLLEGSIYFLGVSGLDVEAIDVLFGFNMDYCGNRDVIVSDAIIGGSALGLVASELSDKPLECEPSFVVSLDEGCYTQARLSLETRCNSFQVRSGQYEDEPISVYFTVRQYPQPGTTIQPKELFDKQCETCEDIVEHQIVPNIVQPIAIAIASAR